MKAYIRLLACMVIGGTLGYCHVLWNHLPFWILMIAVGVYAGCQE